MTDRYHLPGTQRAFQPGSDGRVLANKFGITQPEDMDELELELLTQLYEDVLIRNLPDRQLAVDDLKTWHRRWLGNVYDWAGQERSVNMSKGGFMFAATLKSRGCWPSLSATAWPVGHRATTWKRKLWWRLSP